MRHLVALVAGGLLMAQTGQTPESPAPTRPMVVMLSELKEMRADLNRFGNQHGDILVEIRALKVHADDMQREVNAQRARMDASDPTKAAETLAILKKDLEERRQRAAEEREESVRNWQAFWGVSRWFGGILAAVAGNEVRKWFSQRHFRMTVEKAVVKPSAPDAE